MAEASTPEELIANYQYMNSDDRKNVRQILEAMFEHISAEHAKSSNFVDYFERVLIYKTVNEMEDFSLRKEHIKEMRMFLRNLPMLRSFGRHVKKCLDRVPLLIERHIKEIPATVVSGLFCFSFVYIIFTLIYEEKDGKIKKESLETYDEGL